jgi:hypothetical protein
MSKFLHTMVRIGDPDHRVEEFRHGQDPSCAGDGDEHRPAKNEDVPLVVELRDGGPGVMVKQSGR